MLAVGESYNDEGYDLPTTDLFCHGDTFFLGGGLGVKLPLRVSASIDGSE